MTGPGNCGWLNALIASNRNCSDLRPPRLVFLSSDRSTLLVRSPRTESSRSGNVRTFDAELLRRHPVEPGVGVEPARQRRIVDGDVVEVAGEEHVPEGRPGIRSGACRSPGPASRRSARSTAGSASPPKRRPRPNGSSQMPLTDSRCGTSWLEMPFPRLRIRGVQELGRPR